MRNSKGQFIKGVRAHPETEFKAGEHWRPHAIFREKDYLIEEYIVKQRSATDIADEHSCTRNAIYFWLAKHNIPTRSMVETRAIKHWGLSGETNGMYGKRGAEGPNWKGGCTPERQAFYSSLEWAEAARQVWARDKGVCRRCGITHQTDIAFHVHHIVSFAVKELRADIDNLLLLCGKCHNWVHSRKNTDKEFIKER